MLLQRLLALTIDPAVLIWFSFPRFPPNISLAYIKDLELDTLLLQTSLQITIYSLDNKIVSLRVRVICDYLYFDVLKPWGSILVFKSPSYLSYYSCCAFQDKDVLSIFRMGRFCLKYKGTSAIL